MAREQQLFAIRGDDFAWKEGVDNITTDQIAEAWFTVKTKAVARSSTDDTGATTQVSLFGSGPLGPNTIPIGISIVDATTLLVTLTSTQTALWTQATYVYDLAIRTNAGKEYTLTRGVLAVQFDVTITR